MRRLIIKVLLPATLLLLCSLENASADCSFAVGSKVANVVYPVYGSYPSSFRNASDGTIIAELGISLNTVKVKCTGANNIGTYSPYGEAKLTSRGVLYPTSCPGISMFTRRYAQGIEMPVYATNSTSLTDYELPGGVYYTRLIKVGPIPVEAKECGGGIVFLAGRLRVADFTFSQPFNFTVPTCTTPSVIVSMGTQKSSGLKRIGNRLPSVPFSIQLNNCAASVSTVTYRLDPLTGDLGNSVVTLSSGSTAKGVGVQILDANNNPLPLQRAIPFTEYNRGNVNAAIKLNAAYYQTGDKVTAGTANTNLTFTMTYQ